MSEINRSGREPIAMVEIQQDFCPHFYAVGACRVGRNNYIVNSADPSTWGMSGYVVTDEVADSDGGTQAHTLTKFAAGSDVITIDSSTPIESGTDFFIEFELKFRTGIESVVIAADGDTLSFDCRVFIASQTATNGYSQTAFDGVTLTDLGGGWVKVSLQVNASRNLTGGLSLQALAIGGGSPATNDAFDFARAQITTEQGQEYAATTGQAWASEIGEACFNTRSTCQDPGSYKAEVLPLRFVSDRSPIPNDDYYIPSLSSVSTTPAAINPGGAKASTSPFGKRATIRAAFKDHPHDDKNVDKYRDQRNYTPFERATFWTKWRARNQYYLQRKIVFVSGYFKDGQIVDSVTREYVITDFSGPDAEGNVIIEGKDILTLAEGKKAQAPLVSLGELDAAIGPTDTTATLAPAGVGDIDYPASGAIRIEKEIMDFTRTGDTLTLSNRGSSGTEAKDHDAGAAVQIMLDYVSQSPQDILTDLLNVYAGIPLSFLDLAQWNEETLDYLPRLYTARIAEPEDVSKLCAEICEQMYLTVYYDERDAKVRIRAVRSAADDEITPLDDRANLIADSISWTDLTDELITQVWVHYGQINPTLKLDQADNYSTIHVNRSADAEAATKDGSPRIKKVFSRWIDATNSTAATDLATRILNRYSTIPRQCTFSLDAKDRSLWLADYVEITNRLNVDRFGLPRPTQLQIQQAQESALGSVYTYVGQQFINGEAEDYDPNARNIDITTNLLNVNLRTLHDNLFGAPEAGVTVTFRIKSGVVVGGDSAGGGVNVPELSRITTNDFYDSGNSTTPYVVPVGVVNILQRSGIASPRDVLPGDAYLGDTPNWLVKEYPLSTALDTGLWPAGVVVNLVVESGAFLVGEAGNGSAHAMQSYIETGSILHKGVPGGDGGHAIIARHALNVVNQGIIGGGGGGGTSTAWVTNQGGGGIVAARGGAGAGSLGFSSGNSFVEGIPQTGGSTIQRTFNREPGKNTPILRGGGGGMELTSFNGWHFNTAPFNPDSDGGVLGGQGLAHFHEYEVNTSNYRFFTTVAGGIGGDAVNAGASLINWINKGDVRGAENG